MNRARVHVPDVIIAVAVTVAALGAGPVFYDLVGIIAGSAGPMETLLLQLVLPMLLIGIAISIGVSARRAD